jgi:parallel beta-helix repeat protein
LIPTQVTITNNLIKSNGHTGINLNLQDIEQTLTTVITGNSIQFNSIHGIALTNAAWADIRNNDFILNNLSNVSNIWLETPFPGPVTVTADWDTLLATSNYWSRAYDPGQASFIEDTVRDKSDNPTLGTYVIIAPWENEKQSSH